MSESMARLPTTDKKKYYEKWESMIFHISEYGSDTVRPQNQ